MYCKDGDVYDVSIFVFSLKNSLDIFKTKRYNRHRGDIMPKESENLVGKTFGELTVVAKIPDDTRRRRYDRWICRCSCGAEVHSRGFYLKNGYKTKCSSIIHFCENGGRFGRLTVFPENIKVKNSKKYYLCKCDCGNEIYVPKHKLVSGHTRSCGCLSIDESRDRFTTHGMTETRLYRTWRGMIARCECPGDAKSYARYGARGITVCEEWHKFESFRDWAFSTGYSDELTIERIDVDGNYCPENCRWATMKEQANNRRNTAWIKYNGEKKSMAQFAEEYKIPYGTLWHRYHHSKMSIEEMLTTPVGACKKRG